MYLHSLNSLKVSGFKIKKSSSSEFFIKLNIPPPVSNIFSPSLNTSIFKG